MSNIAEVKRLREQCRVYDLSGADYIDRFKDVELSANYNGIGPDWFPAALRSALDRLCDSLRPCALIHDIRWWQNDGSRRTFYFSNAEFRENGATIARELYSWFDPRRYLLIRRAKIFGNLCDEFGWSAYRTAFEKRIEKETKR